jgi:hypothetical protein
MGLGDVVDQLLNDDRLADPGATEQADLAAIAASSRLQTDRLRLWGLAQMRAATAP